MARNTYPTAALALLAAFFAGLTLAHRAPGSLTTIQWNADTATTEIVHRLHSHDAEIGVGTRLGEPGLSALTIEGRARIALYTEARFGIKSGDTLLPLVLVGAEVSSDYVLVYQEWPGRLPNTISIRNSILTDAFKAQINQVNVDEGRGLRTLTFTNSDTWQSINLGKP